MKKILLLAILMMACHTLMAQPKPNSFFAGGSFSFSVESYKNKEGGTSTVSDKVTNLSVYPEIGYFISDKLAVGALVGGRIGVDKYPTNTNNTKSVVTGIQIAPFARYYIINQQFGIFAEASMGFGLSTTKDYYQYTPDLKSSQQTFSLGVSPGIYYSLSEHLTLESKVGWVGFSSTNHKNSDDTSNIYNEFGLNLSSSSFYFGFNWVF